MISSLLKLVLIFGLLTLTVAPVPTLIVLFLSSVTFNITSYILSKSNSTKYGTINKQKYKK